MTTDIPSHVPLARLCLCLCICICLCICLTGGSGNREENDNGYSLPRSSHQNRNMNKLAPTTTRNSPAMTLCPKLNLRRAQILVFCNFEVVKLCTGIMQNDATYPNSKPNWLKLAVCELHVWLKVLDLSQIVLFHPIVNNLLVVSRNTYCERLMEK